jgi:hypothetical protein
MARSNDTTINTASGINVVAGLWLIIAPFILNYAFFGGNPTNDIILGIVIGILALIRISNHDIVWPSWINLIAGIWLIISPFVLGYSSIPRIVWNDIILGVVVGVLAITSAVSTNTMEISGQR